jgi:hypothetical protein
MNSILIIAALIICLIASILMNTFLMWYIWRALQQTNYYELELREVTGVIQNFTNHLETVYEMEMFYGDETLRYLLQHARDLTEAFSQYEEYSEEEPEEPEEPEGKLNEDTAE